MLILASQCARKRAECPKDSFRKKYIQKSGEVADDGKEFLVHKQKKCIVPKNVWHTEAEEKR